MTTLTTAGVGCQHQDAAAGEKFRELAGHFGRPEWPAALRSASASSSLPSSIARRDVEFQRLQERLHRLDADAEDEVGAARCAFWLALYSLLRGEIGPANAWIARGQRLVEDRDCAERGYVLLAVAGQERCRRQSLEIVRLQCRGLVGTQQSLVGVTPRATFVAVPAVFERIHRQATDEPNRTPAHVRSLARVAASDTVCRFETQSYGISLIFRFRYQHSSWW